MAQHGRTLAAGFTLLPVVMTMSLIGAFAFMLNRDNGLNVNQIGAQSDLMRARYAAEAGLQAANYNIQVLGCAGGYPILGSAVADGNFVGATYSAYADRSTTPTYPPGTLTLTSTGTFNGASVTLTKANVYVYYSGVSSWTTPVGKVTNTYVETGNPNRNYGGSTWLYLDKNNDEVLLRFDLSPLPAGSRIVAASVTLYEPALTGSTNAFLVKLITQSWVAGTKNGSGGTPDGATWRTYDGVGNWLSPAGYDPRALVSVPDPLLGFLVGGTFNFDVTTTAQRWMSLPSANYGVWLDPSNSAKNYQFASTTSSSNYPKLIVSYLLPCGATAAP